MALRSTAKTRRTNPINLLPKRHSLLLIARPIGVRMISIFAMLFLTYAFLWSGASARATDVENSAEQSELLARKMIMEWDAGSRRSAIQNFFQAADQWSKSANPSRAAECLRQASRQQSILSSDDEARRTLEGALVIEASPDLSAGKSQTLSLLALVALRAGDPVKAKSLLEESGSAAANSPNPRTRALNAFASAEYHYYARQFKISIESYENSILSWQATGDLSEEAGTLVSYAYALVANDDPFNALEKALRAESVFAELNDRRGLALARIATGHIYSVVDDKQRALEAYQKARTGFPDGIDGIEKGRLSNGLGLIFEDHGDWRASLNFRKEAFESFKQERYPYGQLSTLPSLIKLSYLVGENDAADKFLEQATILSKSLGDEVLLAVSRNYVADHFVAIGADAGAERLYKQSIAVLKKNQVQYQAAVIRASLAQIAFRRGDIKSAQDMLTMALEVHRRIKSRFGEAEVLFELAQLHASSNDRQKALSTITESVAITDALYSEISMSHLQSLYYSENFARYALLVDLLMKDHQSKLEGFQAVERARARMLLETVLRSGSGDKLTFSPEEAAKEKTLRALLNLKLDRLTDLLGSGATEEVQALEAEITSIRSELDIAKASLAARDPVRSAIKDPPQFDLREFQANVLGDNDVLLEYFLGKDESYLWFVGKNEFEAFTLPGRDVIEAKVDDLRALLDARKPVAGEGIEQMRKRVADADARYAPLAGELSDVLLGPVSDKLTGKRIIVVPDGKLHYFGISALPLPNSESDEPVLLTNEVVYQPSAQTLSLLTKFRSRAVDAPDRDLLVFSDPVFSSDDVRLAGTEPPHVARQDVTLNLRFAESHEGLQRLPASGKEAETIRNIVGGRGTDIFTGFGATRDQLLGANLSDYKIIHLATHGLINQERPELSAVVLSRFDENGQRRDESVRLQDIYAMKLNADLVVLSACQTAAGKEIKGEGVMGLNSAFLQAGAHSVVASLWQVDDNATNLLMKEFYRGMANGLSVSAALREAQLALYRDPQFRSPFFWAAFTLQGDMNRRPDIGSGSYAWWFVGLSAMFVVAGIVLWKKFGRRLPTRR